MSSPAVTILLVDPDVRARALLAEQLTALGCEILVASDGNTAMRIVRARQVNLVVSELYLATEEHRCLIQAIRVDRALRRTRTLAHTHRSTATDRDWAMHAGADGYLVKPTRAERVRYVVGRLMSARAPNASAPYVSPIERRDSLDAALSEFERGALTAPSCIVFARGWWDGLSRAEQASYRRRATSAHVALRSDSKLTAHYVEVRALPDGVHALASERPESPYRR